MINRDRHATTHTEEHQTQDKRVNPLKHVGNMQKGPDMALEPRTFPSSCCEMAVLATVRVTITLKKEILQFSICSVISACRIVGLLIINHNTDY